MATPSLEEVVSRARADGRSESFIAALKSDYRRRFQLKSYETGEQVSTKSDIPRLEDVLERARQDGKDDDFLARLEEDYYRRYPQRKPKATGTEGDAIERTEEVDDYGIDRNEFGGIDSLPYPVDETLVATTGTVNPTIDEGLTDNVFNRVVKEKGWSFNNATGQVVNSQGHVMFKDGEWTQFGISALRIPQNVVSENNWVRHGDGRIEDEYGGVVWDPKTGLTNLESQESIIGRMNFPDVELDLNEESDLEAAEEQVLETSLEGYRNAIDNDEVLQPIIQNINNQIDAEREDKLEELNNLYDFSNPEEFQKAQTEYSKWYLDRFNSLASENATYNRRMSIYNDAFRDRIAQESHPIFNEYNQRRVDENWDNLGEQIAAQGTTGKVVAGLLDVPVVGDAIKHVFTGVKQLQSWLKEGQVSNTVLSLQQVQDVKANVDPNKTYRVVKSSTGQILYPESRPAWNPGTTGTETVVEVSAEEYLLYLQDREQRLTGDFVSQFVEAKDLERIVGDYGDSPALLDPDGTVNWGLITSPSEVAALILEQGPMFAVGLVPGLSTVGATGEQVMGILRDTAPRILDKPWEQITPEELLGLLESEKINHEQVLRTSAGYAALDYVSFTRLLSATRRLLNSTIKGGYRNIGNYLAASAQEFGAEAGQNLLVQRTVEDHTGKPIDLDEALAEGYAGSIVSLVLPIPGGGVRLGRGAVSRLRSSYANAMYQAADIENVINHKDEVLIPAINDAVENGEISAEEGAEIIRDIELTSEAAQQVPENLSPKDKERAIPLIKERDALREEIKGKDKAFTQTQRERIKAIDEELASIGQTATTVEAEPEPTVPIDVAEQTEEEAIPQTAAEFEAIILGREIEDLEGRRDYLQGELARRGDEEGFVNSNDYKQMLAEFKRLNDRLYYKNKSSLKYDRTTDEGAPFQDPNIEEVKREFAENKWENDDFTIRVEEYSEATLKEGRRAESDLFRLWREAGVQRAPENIGELRAKKGELDPGLYKRLLVDYYIAGEYLYNPELDSAGLIEEIKSLADVEMVKTEIDELFDNSIEDLARPDGKVRIARVVWLNADPETKDVGSSWSVDPNFPNRWLEITKREAFGGDPYVIYATIDPKDVQNFLPVGQFGSTTQSEIMVLDSQFPSDSFTWERLDPETFQSVKIGQIKEDGRTREERRDDAQEGERDLEGARRGDRATDAQRQDRPRARIKELYSADKYKVDNGFMDDYYEAKKKEIKKSFKGTYTEDREEARVEFEKAYKTLGYSGQALVDAVEKHLNAAGGYIGGKFIYTNKEVKKPDTPRHEQTHTYHVKHGYVWLNVFDTKNPLFDAEHARLEKSYKGYKKGSRDYIDEFLAGLLGKWEILQEDGITSRLGLDPIVVEFLDSYLESVKTDKAIIPVFNRLTSGADKVVDEQQPPKRDFTSGLDAANESVQKVAADPNKSKREIVEELTKKQTLEFLVESEQHAENLKEKVEYEEKPVTKQAEEDPEFFATEEQKEEAEGLVLTAIAAGKVNKETEQGAKKLIRKLSDKKIAARLGFVLQDINEGVEIGSVAFTIGRTLFPNIGKLIEGSPKRAEGTVGLYALQFLVDAGIIEFRKRGTGRRAPFVITFKDEKKFWAFIQSQDPKKVEKLIPRGSSPYFEGPPVWTEQNEDDITIVGGKFDKDLLEDLTEEKYPKVYEEANNAAQTELSINQYVLRFYQQIMRKPVFTFRDKKLGAGERRTKRQKLVSNMEMAEHIGSKSFWMRPVYELRSRIRSAMKALNHQGDKQGLSLIYLKPVRLGEGGVAKLLIQAADFYGFKGRDFDERIEFARENFATWMEWASDPKKYYNEIMNAKEHWIFYATINELYDALAWAKANDSSITEFESGLPWHSDQTASGLGIITTIMKDPEHAGTLNIDEDQERGDPYTELGIGFFEAQGTWSAADISEAIEVATELGEIDAKLEKGGISSEDFQALVDRKAEIKKEKGKKRMEELRKAFFSRPEVKEHYVRKMGKIVAMTKYYGSNEFGMKDNVISELSPEVDHFPGLPEEWAWHVAKELNAAADARFPAAKRYMDTMKAIGKANATDGMIFTGKNNKFPMKNRPTKSKKGQVKEQKYRGDNTINKSQTISLTYHEYTNEPDPAKAGTQASSFMTHASDAQIPAWLFLNAKDLHGYLLTIHDNFLVPAGMADKLASQLRKGYKDTFKGDYLKNIIEEIFGGEIEAAQPFLDMLQIGDLDISEMDLSHHIFDSGNGLTRERDFGEATNVFEQKESQNALEEAKGLLIEDQSQKVSEDKRCK